MTSPLASRSEPSLAEMPSMGRPRRRHTGSTATTRPPPLGRSATCYPMPHTRQYQQLDLQSSSPTETLASIRLLVLSYLADLEASISEADIPWKGQGEMTVEEIRHWSTTTLEKLETIRDDVCSHLPDLSIGDVAAMEDFVKARLPDMPKLDDFSSRLPDIPHMPEFTLPDFKAKLEEVCEAFQNIDIPQPLSYVPKLTQHLDDLHDHLADFELPSHLWSRPSALLSEMLDSLMNSDLVQEILATSELDADDLDDDGDFLESAAAQAVHITRAVARSLEGTKLITLADVPRPWQSNPFVTHGYRFIPLDKWPLIVLSVFALHNETLNIHTHLIPFLSWSFQSIPFFNDSVPDTPELIFTVFALVCLGTSAVWHIMAGCAHASSMEFCARLDYVGIGWLISASVGTVVHYGFACHPNIGNSFLLLCFTTGILGTILPFMKWFNDYEYRYHRIAFFLSMAFTAVGPMAFMSYLHSTSALFNFIKPIFPSLASYVVGLFFYATHWPECWIPAHWSKTLDVVGWGSHCIWHLFIVLAVALHKSAIPALQNGIAPCHM